jgi:Retrotransposon gag protein
MQVDPSALVIPTDQAQLPQFLQELKNSIVAINHNLALLMSNISGDLATSNAALQNHDEGISNLESSLVKVVADMAKLSGPGSAGSSSLFRKSPKLSEPTKFDGSDKNKAVSFRVAVSHYLRVSYPGATVDEQVAYIISCLEGKAHEWLEPYLEQDVVSGSPVSWLHDTKEFWEQFNARWNVSNKTENFRAKFRSLKQTKSVQDYFKDFQTYSQNLGYNDVSLRDFF